MLYATCSSIISTIPMVSGTIPVKDNSHTFHNCLLFTAHMYMSSFVHLKTHALSHTYFTTLTATFTLVIRHAYLKKKIVRDRQQQNKNSKFSFEDFQIHFLTISCRSHWVDFFIVTCEVSITLLPNLKLISAYEQIITIWVEKHGHDIFVNYYN